MKHHIKCDGCGRKFKTVEALESHIKIKNTEPAVMESMAEIVGENSPIYKLQESANRDLGGGFQVVAKNKGIEIKRSNAEEIAKECIKNWLYCYDDVRYQFERVREEK